jgi:hypothetical protein
MSTKTESIYVQLHLPKHDVTVEEFEIAPSMKYRDIVENVKTELQGRIPAADIHEIYLNDVNGEPLQEYENCSHTTGFMSVERILIAVRNERIRPERKLDVCLFLEKPVDNTPLRVSTPTLLLIF